MTASEFAERVSARRTGEGRWMAKCPGHEDRRSSLSIREGKDGRVLVHDFAGCEVRDILDAIGLTPRDLFADNGLPWTPRPPRPDPDREARALFERLRALRAPPPPERMREELVLVGRLILGGTEAMRTPGFKASDLRCLPLRIVFQAAQELAAQGTPRRWFSPLALAREVERVEHCWGLRGRSWRRDVFLWTRMAVAMARGQS